MGCLDSSVSKSQIKRYFTDSLQDVFLLISCEDIFKIKCSSGQENVLLIVLKVFRVFKQIVN